MTHFVVVEGPTEVDFVTQVLNPMLAFHLHPQLVRGPRQGGYASYSVWRRRIKALLNPKTALVTTMLDLFALPRDFPHRDTQRGSSSQWIIALEAAFYDDIDDQRFVPYISLHEFEALLFSEPDLMDSVLGKGAGTKAKGIVKKHGHSPELINDQNPPSYHLKQISPTYDKVRQGIQIAQLIGLDRIREKCSHFNDWLTRLEKFTS